MKPLNPRSLDRLAGGGLRNSPASRTRAIIPMRRGPALGLGVEPGLHGPAEPRSASWEERAILEALTGRPGFTPHGQGRPHRPAGLGRPGPRPRRWEATNRPNGAAAGRREGAGPGTGSRGILTPSGPEPRCRLARRARRSPPPFWSPSSPPRPPLRPLPPFSPRLGFV